jgi:predicted secreted protein
MRNGLLIQGKNVHVFKYIDAAPFEIVCGTDVLFELQKELIGATTPDSGKFKEVRPRLKEFFVTISGASTSENDSDISVFYMLEEDVVDDVQDIEIVYTNNEGNDVSIRGSFFIETLSIGGPAEGSSTYEIRLRSWGEYTSTTLADPEVLGINVTSDSFTIVSSVVQNNDWIGLTSANIIEVCREGTEQLSMNLTWTFDGTTGTITPDPDTTIDGQILFVVWTYN